MSKPGNKQGFDLKGFTQPEHKGLKRGSGKGGGGARGGGSQAMENAIANGETLPTNLNLSAIPLRVAGAPVSDLREVIPVSKTEEAQTRVTHAQNRAKWADYISSRADDQRGMKC